MSEVKLQGILKNGPDDLISEVTSEQSSRSNCDIEYWDVQGDDRKP